MKYLTGIVVSLVASPAIAYRTFLDGYFPGLASSFKKTVNTTLEAGKLLTQAGSNSGGSLVFEDNFDELNFKRWRHEVTLGGGGNWEFQHYNNNRSVSYTEDGVLYIKPMLTAEVVGEAAVMNGGTLDLWGNMPNFQCTANAFYGCMRSSNGENILNPIQSAQLRSHQSFNFRYGKVEVRARLPKGDWIWPAIWFLPTDHEYGMWPSSGEIDLVESRGNAPGYPAGGVDTVMSTLHWGPSFEFNRYEQTSSQYKLPNGQTFADDFHTFTLEWSSDAINTFVDGNPVLRVPITESFWDQGKFPASQANPWKHSKSKAAPFDKDFYIIFNVAVGGTNSYFPEGSGKPWSNKSPTAAKDFYLAKNQWLPTWPEDDRRALAIDYVRVWQYE